MEGGGGGGGQHASCLVAKLAVEFPRLVYNKYWPLVIASSWLVKTLFCFLAIVNGIRSVKFAICC